MTTYRIDHYSGSGSQGNEHADITADSDDDALEALELMVRDHIDPDAEPLDYGQYGYGDDPHDEDWVGGQWVGGFSIGSDGWCQIFRADDAEG